MSVSMEVIDGLIIAGELCRDCLLLDRCGEAYGAEGCPAYRLLERVAQHGVKDRKRGEPASVMRCIACGGEWFERPPSRGVGETYRGFCPHCGKEVNITVIQEAEG